MMLAKRIIPCLDVSSEGRVVKGVNFVNFKDAGDPVELAAFYSEQGADEIVFLDISATHEGRKSIVDVIRKTAEKVFVPLSVGGGIRSVDDFTEVLRAGADKVAINSAAVRDKTLISQAAEKFGSQCVILAIDAREKQNGTGYEVVINGGRIGTGIDLVEWAIEGEKLGAGEILLTSMNTDGTKDGFDVSMLKAVTEAVSIPVVASGGAGKLEHFSDVFHKTDVSAALAASLFHFGELTIPQVKVFLRGEGIIVRDAPFSPENLFAKNELIPVIAQDVDSREVLMLGFANEEAVRKTIETGTAWFYSRSRKSLWNKGETSGNYLHVKKIFSDCDRDSLLLLCRPEGPTCHTGKVSCFFEEIEV